MEALGICSVCKRKVTLYYFHPDDLYYAHTHFGCKGEICDGGHQLPAAYIEMAGEASVSTAKTAQNGR